MESDDLVLYYGIGLNEGLVFIPRPQAHELANLIRALNTAATWGEFRQQAGEVWYNEALEWNDAANEPPPDAQPFDPDDIAGFANGDWPAWPAQEMLDWMPDEVQSQYARAEDTRLNGDYLHIDPEYEEAVIEILEDYGYRCTRNQAIIDLVEKHFVADDDDLAVDL